VYDFHGVGKPESTNAYRESRFVQRNDGRSRRLQFGGPGFKTGVTETPIEGEYAGHPAPPHQGERHTVSETYPLAGELGEKIERFQLVVLIRPNNGELTGQKQP